MQFARIPVLETINGGYNPNGSSTKEEGRQEGHSQEGYAEEGHAEEGPEEGRQEGDSQEGYAPSPAEEGQLKRPDIEAFLPGNASDPGRRTSSAGVSVL